MSRRTTLISATCGGVGVKSIVKRMASAVGLEVRRIPGPPKWPKPDSDPPLDELVPGPWFYHALQMANRSYHPPQLRYHRTPFGDDDRLKYIAYFLDVRELRVLEIGPLEGHHSILLEKMGVRENIAIEARAENLVKCNRIKEKYRLDRTIFFQADLEELYRGEKAPGFDGPFDLVFCLGVLYHVPEPAKALEWFRSQSETLFLGTQYIDELMPSANRYSHKGKNYRAVYQEEGGMFDSTGRFQRTGGALSPLSGMSACSVTLYEDDLISMLRDCGYSRVSVLGKDFRNGAPHITILAQA